MKLPVLTIMTCLFVGVCGCDNASSRSLREQVAQLGRENKVLKQQTEELVGQNKALTEQVESLSSLNSETRVDVLPAVEKIEFGRRSGLFDKDKDGKNEKLIVYLRLFDCQGDLIKAAGKASVQLWDLNAEEEDALIKQWEIGPGELKELWVGTFMTNYYRLTFDVGDLLEGIGDELTVKLTFTDYVTGKVFREQKVIQR